LRVAVAVHITVAQVVEAQVGIGLLLELLAVALLLKAHFLLRSEQLTP
jgi:hypothetical protein